MSTVKSLRSNVVTLMVGALLATSLQVSEASAESGAPESALATAIDIVAIRDSYLAANPGKKSLNIMRHKNRGFQFYANGRVVQVAQGIGTQYQETQITSANSKEVCVAAVGTYVGGCMTLSKVGGEMMFYLKYNTDKTSPKSWKARFLE